MYNEFIIIHCDKTYYNALLSPNFIILKNYARKNIWKDLYVYASVLNNSLWLIDEKLTLLCYQFDTEVGLNNKKTRKQIINNPIRSINYKEGGGNFCSKNNIPNLSHITSVKALPKNYFLILIHIFLKMGIFKARTNGNPKLRKVMSVELFNKSFIDNSYKIQSDTG